MNPSFSLPRMNQRPTAHHVSCFFSKRNPGEQYLEAEVCLQTDRMSADASDQPGRAVTADADGSRRSDGAKELVGAVTPRPRRSEAATHHQTPAGGPVLPDIALQMGRSLRWRQPNTRH